MASICFSERYELEGHDDGRRHVELLVAVEEVVVQGRPQHLRHHDQAVLPLQVFLPKPVDVREKSSVSRLVRSPCILKSTLYSCSRFMKVLESS
jgi:hypothetical protein